ncbi:MAG: THUMP domain-containing protein, partial [Gemmatimonadota bacterium]
MSAAEHLILVRLSAEVTIKSRRTRNAFMRRLLRNMRDALDSVEAAGEITSEWGRVFVRTSSPAALPALARVFGISSLSVIDRTVPAELDAIEAAALELYPEQVRDRRFAVRARRTGQHPFSSKDV